MRTQEYTAVICIAERSLTFLPMELPPIKNRYALPDVAFFGLSLDLKIPFNIPIAFTLLFISKFFIDIF